MTLHKIFLILLLIPAAAMPATACAGDYNAAYVSISDLPPTLLLPPYALNSTGWKKDISTVVASQKYIGATDLNALRDEQRMRMELVTDIMGPDFTRDKKPMTFALLDHVYADIGAISEADKQYWHTRRPYLENKHVKLLVNRIDNSPAYPSGHTSESRVIAEVLGLLYPDHLAALRARADAIAWHRVEAGVHYPQDLEAGRSLAMLMMGALMKSAAFQDNLNAARGEITR